MELLHNIIGDVSVQWFISMMLFALVGATINLLLNVSERDKNSDNTPYHFSLKFMLLDNWKRMLSTLLLIFVFVRFMPLVLPSDILSTIKDEDALLFMALIIGYSFDKLSEILKDKLNILTVNRSKVN